MSVFHQLKTLSDSTVYNYDEYLQIYMMEGIVKRVAESNYKELFVLRGGMLSRFWYQQGKWMPSDIDFMVETPIPPTEMEEIWQEMMAIHVEDDLNIDAQNLVSDIIWATAKEPGLRLWIPIRLPVLTEVQLIQIDISYADPTIPPAAFQYYPSIIPNKTIYTKMVYKETSAGWKLYGLFERSQDRWRAKDLFGLYWLLTHFDLDKRLVMQSFKATCVQRGTPFAMAARLFENQFGQGRESQRQWKNFCKEKSSFKLDTALDNILYIIRQELTAHYIELLKNTAQPTRFGKNGFPIIRHIDEVLHAIQDRDEFRVYYRENYRIIDYINPSKYTFMARGQAIHPSVEAIYTLRKACRGLIFDKEGQLVARKLHKFFRIGEREDTTIKKIDWSAPCRILEKLDGSLVVPVLWNDNIRWTTRKGLSTIAEQAAHFAQAHDHKLHKKKIGYQALIQVQLERGNTCIFEWCSQKHPIVLDYPKDKLVLTAIRSNETGDYVPFEQQIKLTKQYQIPCVKQIGWIHNRTEAKYFIDTVKNETIGEGYILRFDDDRFYKVKNDRYFDLHNLVAHHYREIFIWQATLSGQVDDLLRGVAPSLRPPVRAFADVIEQEVSKIVAWAEKLILGAIQMIKRIQLYSDEDKNKYFAVHYASPLNNAQQKLIFTLWHNYQIHQNSQQFTTLTNAFILSYCTTRRRLEKIRPFLNNIRFIDPNLAYKKQQFNG